MGSSLWVTMYPRKEEQITVSAVPRTVLATETTMLLGMLGICNRDL